MQIRICIQKSGHWANVVRDVYAICAFGESGKRGHNRDRHCGLEEVFEVVKVTNTTLVSVTTTLAALNLSRRAPPQVWLDLGMV
jgi:hypothetical protein